MGVPGCPLLAAWTASMLRVRIVSIAVFSIVGAETLMGHFLAKGGRKNFLVIFVVARIPAERLFRNHALVCELVSSDSRTPDRGIRRIPRSRVGLLFCVVFCYTGDVLALV